MAASRVDRSRGPLSREYGIPGVFGTRDATGRIADGMRVRVDGDAGEVTVLA